MCIHFTPKQAKKNRKLTFFQKINQKERTVKAVRAGCFKI